MSTEARLARLGLLHLINKPDELVQELDRQIAIDDALEEKFEQEREERLAARKKAAEEARRRPTDEESQ